MSIQTTRYISRRDAEERWIRGYVERHKDYLNYTVKGLSNTELENELETTFDNYSITD